MGGLALLLLAIIAAAVLIRQNSAGNSFGQKWIAYLGQPLEAPDVWRVSLDGAQPVQLTFTGGQVIDFAVSPDGRSIIYSVKNSQGGSDLYIMRADGSGQKLLVAGVADRCTQPAWSAQSNLVAYSRLQRGQEVSDKVSQERIWTVNAKSGRTRALFSDELITGRSPVFSSDGNRLAFYDTSKEGIHIFDIRNGKSQVIPTQIDQSGVFSPDGTQLIFSDLQEDQLPPVARFFIANLVTKTITPFLQPELAGFDVASPAWSPDGSQITFGAHPVDGGGGQQLWIVQSTGSDLHAIMQDPSAVQAAPAWSPDGSMLLFQRLELGASVNRPEIVLWDRSADQFKVLARDAALPAWIP